MVKSVNVSFLNISSRYIILPVPGPRQPPLRRGELPYRMRDVSLHRYFGGAARAMISKLLLVAVAVLGIPPGRFAR